MLSAKRSLPGNFQKVNLPEGHRFFPDCKRESFARWIEWSMWTGENTGVWFVTLTFKTFIEEWRSYKLLKVWLGHLRQGYEDKGGHQLRWILATEWQVRKVVHYHLLISGRGLSELSRKRWEVRWESGDRNAGFCRIYDADRKAAPYLAKYMHKGGELTWGGYWRGLSTPASVKCCQPSVQSSVESLAGSRAAVQ